MAQESTQKFLISIPNFNGDPSAFNFFKEQFCSMVEINKLSDANALAYLKSRLSGPALSFYVESPHLHAITDPKQLLKELGEFFPEPPDNNAVQDFNSIQLLPGENIPSLAHRIKRLTAKVYPLIKDEIALQQVMLVKFMQAIPPTLKVKVIESKQDSFDKAVTFAHQLHRQYAANAILNHLTDFPHTGNSVVASLQQQVHLLETKVNNPTHPSPPQRNDNQHSVQAHRTQHLRFRNHGSRRELTRKKFNNHSRSGIRCQFCSKPGHVLRNCFKFQQQYPTTNLHKKYSNSTNRQSCFHIRDHPSTCHARVQCCNGFSDPCHEHTPPSTFSVSHHDHPNSK